MARKRSRRSSKSAWNMRPIIIGTMAMVTSIAIVLGIFYLWIDAGSAVKLDEAMCPVDGPVGITVLLVDTTDPISVTTLTDARNRLQNEINKAKVGERIEIHALTENIGEVTEMFAGCKPDDGSQTSAWTSNPRLMKHDWEQFFNRPLADVSSKLDQGEAGNQSPIMAAVQSIKLNVYDKLKDHDIPNRLIILSDMIEHTKSFSLYRAGTDYTTFKVSGAYHEFKTDLTGIGVEIWFIDRGIPRFRNSTHMNFWLNWVGGNLGELRKAISLEGVNTESNT